MDYDSILRSKRADPPHEPYVVAVIINGAVHAESRHESFDDALRNAVEARDEYDDVQVYNADKHGWAPSGGSIDGLTDDERSRARAALRSNP